jgi:ElaB/YqjD/DUF883 family membrane-anchored ribosome-binding protein
MPNHKNRVGNQIGSHTRNAVHELQLEAQALGEKAQQRVQDLGESARQCVTDFQGDIEERITRSPLKSVLIAAGAGMLLGLFFRR